VFQLYELSSGLLENSSNVSTFIVRFIDTLDVFSRRPDDDSLELKHVALNIIVVVVVVV